jgi:hypothetical protein
MQNLNELRDGIVTAAECFTNEMLVNSRRETEHHLDVFRATNSAHIEMY